MGEGNSLRKSNQLCWVSKEAGSSWGGGEFMCACACVFYIYFSSAGGGRGGSQCCWPSRLAYLVNSSERPCLRKQGGWCWRNDTQSGPPGFHMHTCTYRSYTYVHLHTHEHTHTKRKGGGGELRRKKYFCLHPLFCEVTRFPESQMNLGGWPRPLCLLGLHGVSSPF